MCAQEPDHKDQGLLQPVQECLDKDWYYKINCLNMPVWFICLPLKEFQVRWECGGILCANGGICAYPQKWFGELEDRWGYGPWADASTRGGGTERADEAAFFERCQARCWWYSSTYGSRVGRGEGQPREVHWQPPQKGCPSNVLGHRHGASSPWESHWEAKIAPGISCGGKFSYIAFWFLSMFFACCSLLSRFSEDVQKTIGSLEDCFLQLAECQHMLEASGKTPEFLGWVQVFFWHHFCWEPCFHVFQYMSSTYALFSCFMARPKVWWKDACCKRTSTTAVASLQSFMFQVSVLMSGFFEKSRLRPKLEQLILVASLESWNMFQDSMLGTQIQRHFLLFFGWGVSSCWPKSMSTSCWFLVGSLPSANKSQALMIRSLRRRKQRGKQSRKPREKWRPTQDLRKSQRSSRSEGF